MLVRSPQAALQRLFDEVGSVDQIGIDERVAKYGTRSVKKAAKLWGLRTAVTMVDLTTLEGKDTPGKVASLCQKAFRKASHIVFEAKPSSAHPSCHAYPSLCVSIPREA